jgi:hypothetical protein
MIALLAAMSMMATAQADIAGCTLHRLEACSGANQLVWDKPFQRALNRFVGTRQADYLGWDATVAVQLMEVLGGPSDDVTRIGSRYRFTACRHHSCFEKGAAVLEPNGRIIALGIIHTACTKKTRDYDCSKHNTLSIFMKTPEDKVVIDNLAGWARLAIDGYNEPKTGPNKLTLDQVEVIKVP